MFSIQSLRSEHAGKCPHFARSSRSCRSKVALHSKQRRLAVQTECVYTIEEGVKEFETFTPPVIDIFEVLSGGAPSTETVSKLKAACEDTGFFCISGHQCNPSALKAVFEASRPFFDLPKSKKLQYVVSDMRAGRGYEVSSEHLDYEKWTQSRAAEDDQIASLLQAHPEASTRAGIMSERFLCGPDCPPSQLSADTAAYGRRVSSPAPRFHPHVPLMQLSSQSKSIADAESTETSSQMSDEEMKELEEVFFPPNVWPEEAPLMQPCMESVYQRLTDVAEALLQICAVALDAPPHFFRDKTDRHHSNMQVSNYSSLVLWPEGPNACMRKKAHADSGTLTILTSDDWLDGAWQAGDGGLQLLNSQGVWQEVAVPRGALLVNLGSLLTRWTNGCWKSTLHRVTNPNQSKFDNFNTSASSYSPHSSQAQSTRRFSLAYFHKVNLDTVVSPRDFPSCVTKQLLHGGVGGGLPPPVRAMDLTRQGILYKYRHLPAAEASAAYHAELAALRNHDGSTGNHA